MKLINWLFRKEFKREYNKGYDEGVTRGYNFGRKLGVESKGNRPETKVDFEIETILKEKGF